MKDDKALALVEDEDGLGLPAQIPTDVGDLDDDQNRLWAGQSLPGDDANPKLEQNLQKWPLPHHVDPRT